MQSIKIQNYSLWVWCYTFWLVRTKIQVRIYGVHLATAYEGRTECSSKTFITMYQIIRCPNSDCIMNSHHCKHLKSDTKEYEELKPGRKSHWENWITKGQHVFYRHSILYYILFQTLVDTVFHVLPLKQTGGTRDIISINTHFRVRTTYDKFQSSTDLISQGESHSHTQDYLQCWMFSK